MIAQFGESTHTFHVPSSLDAAIPLSRELAARLVWSSLSDPIRLSRCFISAEFDGHVVYCFMLETDRPLSDVQFTDLL